MKYFLRSSLPSAEEGQLSVSGKRLRTILIIKPHRGLSLPVKVKFGKLTTLYMTSMGSKIKQTIII